MASIKLKVNGDIRTLQRKMRALTELEDLKGVMKSLGEGVRTGTKERFKEEKSPDDKKWKKSIRAVESSGKTLTQTAKLRNSIRVRANNTGFAVGTNLIYAATHQFGDKRTIRAKNAKALRFMIGGNWVSKKSVRVTIPARPFLGLSEGDIKELAGGIEDAIAMAGE